MIVKCKRNLSNQSIGINTLYPVIAYEQRKESKIAEVQVLDDAESLSWISDEWLYFVSKSLADYIEINYQGRNIYVHKHLNYNDFLLDFYMENENSTKAFFKLQEILISILVCELTTDEIIQNISKIGYKSDSVDILLKAFFEKAARQEIKEFSDKLYNVVLELDNYILQIIVDNLKFYKEKEIENLFMKIYISLPCSIEITEVISTYLEF